MVNLLDLCEANQKQDKGQHCTRTEGGYKTTRRGNTQREEDFGPNFNSRREIDQLSLTEFDQQQKNQEENDKRASGD